MKCVAALLFSLAIGLIPECALAQPMATTTVLTANTTSSPLGTPVQLTAVVTPGTATGAVAFFDGVTYLGRQALVSGVATLSTVQIGAGVHSLTAVYSGDTNDLASVSAAIPLTVTTAAGGGFFVDTPVPVGTLPVSVAYADLNGDSKVDLVTVNQTTNNVTVSLGNGDGTFQAGMTFAVGMKPSSIAIADVNSDGKPDLVVANEIDNTVSVLFGSGTGTFGAAVPYPAGTAPNKVVVGDFNGDGVPDLAVTSGMAQQVSILLGTGAGVFGTATNIPLGGTPQGIAIGDFNGDGHTDLAIVNFTNVLSHVSILLGVGNGTFSAPTNLNVGAEPLDVIAGDFNGDGKTDLAIACFNTNAANVLLGNGDGTFAAAVAYPVGSGPFTLVDTDFNGDGKLDLAVVNSSGNSLSILLGSGDGTFEPQFQVATGTGPKSIVAADFSGDSRADLAVANSGDNDLTILLGRQVSSTALNVSPNPAAPGQTVTLTATVTPGTVTGIVTFNDGTTPIGMMPVSGGVATLSTNSLSAGAHSITAVYSGDSNFAASTSPVVVLNIGGIVTPTLAVNPTNATLGAPVTMTVTVVPNTATGDVTFYDGATVLDETALVNGQATFTTSLLGAGVHNLIARYDGGGGNLAAYTATVPVTINAAPAGGFTPPTSYATGTGATASILGDFNRDGIADIATVNFISNTVSILIGVSGGTFQPAVDITVGTNPDAIAMGDFNGDGIQDLIVSNYSSANLSLLLGNSDGTFQPPATIASGAMPSGVVAADFNGDGFVDFAVSENGTNNVTLYLGNGDGTFAAPAAITVASGLKGITTGSLHAPQVADLVVAGGSGAYVLINNGTGTFAPPVLYTAGVGPTAVALADLLGNGTLDLIVVNSQSNNVSVLLGNGNGTFQAAVNYGVGIFPQSVAVGDYNGDGKLDLAVANEGSGFGTGGISRLIGNGDGTFQAAVNFADGSNGTPTSVATGALSGNGQANLAVSNFSGGTVDILFALNASSVLLTADPNPDPLGSPVTLTATVSPSSATGTVAFFAGTLALGTAPVSGGVAAITVNIASGNQSLTAVYSGDTVFGPSTSPVVMDVIGQIPTSISLVVSPTTATFGTPVTFTATVSTPGVIGYVTFLTGTTVIGASPLNNGVATLITSLLPAGPQTITARFDGSMNFASSSSVTAALNVAAVADYSFNPPVAVPAGFPVSVVASDFNLDGKIDLAVANSGVSILLGNGNGTFAAGANLTAGSGPTQVVTGDFNADGKPDLAVANGASGSVSVQLGNGDGTFQPTVSYTVGSGPSSLVLADLNGDGIVDIAVANKNDGSVSILLGHGEGTFAAAVNVAVGSSNNFIAQGDFNNDGAPDLVVADSNGPVVWLLLNTGNGTFAPPVSFPANAAPVALTVADFNRDGFPDVAIANQTGNTVTILFGTGSGGFQPGVVIPAGTSPQYVASSDFNGDGILDLLVANQAGLVSVMLGNSNGTFQPPFPFATGSDPVSLAVNNFTGNGKPQVAAASLGTNTISLLLDGPAAVTSEAGTPQFAPAESTYAQQFSAQTTGFGAPVTGVPVTFTAPTSGASGIFMGSGPTVTVVSGLNGIATAPFFTANTFAGPFTVTASTGIGTTAVTSFSLTNTVTGCSFSIAPTSLAFDNTGGTATLTVTAVGNSCVWSAASASPWISFSSPGGTGSGSTTVTVAPNTTGVALTGNILIGGQVVTVSEGATAQIFADVPPSAYYFDAANMLYAKGITNGCGGPPLIFCPAESISRAQMAIFLVRSVYGGDSFTASPVPYFTDVPVGSFGFQWIQKLFELGITQGCGVNLFCPAADVTRAQMGIFLIRVRLGATAPFNYPPTPFFTDVPTGSFGFQWIQRLKEDQITSGCGPTLYCPNNPVTRGETAVLLLRAAFNELLPAGYPAISQISTNSIAAGQSATVTITGVNTNYVQGTVSLLPINNVTFGPITVNSPTSLTVQVTVSSTATPQPYSVTTVSGYEEDVLPNGLTVTPNPCQNCDPGHSN